MARTNQWRVTGVKLAENRPGMANSGWRKVRPFSPPVQVKVMT